MVTNKKWLDSLDSASQEKVITKWRKVYFTGTLTTDELLIKFLNWLALEHIEELEKCPLKCPDCDRYVETFKARFTDSFGNFKKNIFGIRRRNGIDEHCFIRGNTSFFDTEVEALKMWNKSAGGEF